MTQVRSIFRMRRFARPRTLKGQPQMCAQRGRGIARADSQTPREAPQKGSVGHASVCVCPRSAARRRAPFKRDLPPSPCEHGARPDLRDPRSGPGGPRVCDRCDRGACPRSAPVHRSRSRSSEQSNIFRATKCALIALSVQSTKQGWFISSASSPVGKISISYGTLGVCAGFRGASQCVDYSTYEGIFDSGSGSSTAGAQEARDAFAKIGTLQPHTSRTYTRIVDSWWTPIIVLDAEERWRLLHLV